MKVWVVSVSDPWVPGLMIDSIWSSKELAEEHAEVVRLAGEDSCVSVGYHLDMTGEAQIYENNLPA